MRNRILTYLLSTSPTKSLLIIEGKRVSWQRRNSADIILIKWPKWASPARRHVMCLLIWRTGEGTPFHPRGTCSKCTTADELQEDKSKLRSQCKTTGQRHLSKVSRTWRQVKTKEPSEAETKETWQLNPMECPGSEKGRQRDNWWHLNRNCRLVNRMVERAFLVSKMVWLYKMLTFKEAWVKGIWEVLVLFLQLCNYFKMKS